jgi:hypothetical protein
MLRPAAVVVGLFFVLRWDSSPFHQSHPPVLTVVVVKPVGSTSCIDSLAADPRGNSLVNVGLIQHKDTVDLLASEFTKEL